MDSPVQAMKTGAVTEEFDLAAADYDRMVGANPGYHDHLEISARRLAEGVGDGGAGLRVVDLGCGTGASTRALARALPQAEIVGVDSSAGMLAVARTKSWSPRVRFVHSRAEDATAARLGGPADAVFAAYLLRNCPDTDAALSAATALARPGAPVVLHEYSVADSAAARAVWTLVCWGVVIPLALAWTRRTRLYRYLWRSVLEFDGAAALRERMCAAGLEDVATRPLPGWQRGIVHTFAGRMPPAGPQAPDRDGV
ncbi:methyltransferase domain-containing protein [Streptomonospora sp. PA3]|uniref:methyltransferase domain-containing protein n=1 Tax=Streptomonospora sp. PA3 TaxID=2607326 RepID=UPI0012DFC3ED|nr:methyltransferase domain-containing protein [Streptomonospora sp. PA3]MUL40295.1 methyltransferase domain-containing protein [Streptomonospora sp. PA3]